MFATIGRSWELTKQSWPFLAAHLKSLRDFQPRGRHAEHPQGRVRGDEEHREPGGERQLTAPAFRTRNACGT